MAAQSPALSFWLTASLAFFSVEIASPSWAQIVPDATLPNPSTVNRNQDTTVINGGTQAGGNLFHSFEQFSIPTGNTAIFNNSLETQNIITRVTGNFISNIDGLIRANGTANLFLLNPNGIVFGPNAQLDIGGSFVGSTATGLQFADGTEFNATSDTPPLLTMSVPMGLQFNRPMGRIINQSRVTPDGEQNIIAEAVVDETGAEILPAITVPLGLRVRDGNTLALVGGEVRLEGGNLTARGGRIELAAIQTGTVTAANQESLIDSPLVLSSASALGIVSLSNESVVFASGQPEGEVLRGGAITVQAEQLTVDSSQITSSNWGTERGADVEVRASEVELRGTLAEGQLLAGLYSQNEGEGRGGDLTVTTGLLRVAEGAILSTTNFGSGQGGDLIIRALESVEVTGVGAANDFPSGLFSDTAGIGESGQLILETAQLRVSDGALISSTTYGEGKAGNLSIQATDWVEVSGSSRIVAQADIGSSGDGGNIRIATGRLILEDGQVSAATRGEGTGGTLTISAREFVNLMQTGPAEVAIGLFATTEGTGQGGNIVLDTRRLWVTGGAQVAASTRGEGSGGTVTVNASEQIELRGVAANGELGGIFARTREESSGDAGSVNLFTNRLRVRDGATVRVDSTLGSGLAAAGDIRIVAGRVELDGGAIAAETAGGDRGNITLDAQDLRLNHNSLITTNATGTGGNIRLDTETLLARNNSDITANSTNSFGGRVEISATGIFGAQSDREGSSNTSDITATSLLGTQFDGVVDIQTPDIDPDAGLVDFPEDIVDVTRLIAQNLCAVGVGSEFTETGRGGLPSSPHDIVSSEDLWVDVSLPSEINSSHPQFNAHQERLTQAIIEAQGWVRDELGNILLVAQADSVTPVNGVWNHSGCVRNLQKDLGKNQSVPDTLGIIQFQVEGSTVFSSERLGQITQKFTHKALTFQDLLAVRTAITQLYLSSGYMTSGAYIPPQKIENGRVKVVVVEGGLEGIKIRGTKRLNHNYIRNRVALSTGTPLNRDRLLEALQLLRLDPLINAVKAELSAGTRPGTNFLEVEIQEANSFNTQLTTDNNRSPGVGTFRRGVGLTEGNLLGFGDRLQLAYTNTEGSHDWDVGYTLPINAKNGTIGFRFSTAFSQIVEPPFETLDIEAKSRNYEFTYRQPLLRSPRQELALGVTVSRQESETTLLDEPFALSLGADEEGKTKISALRFFQDWTKRDNNQILSLVSQFSFGVGLFNATQNSNAPDSHFFAWRGQGQWVRQLATDTLLFLRGDIQVSDRSLVPLEQFSLGGTETIRGYRQDALLRDNGLFLSTEVRVPIVRFDNRQGLLQVIPFVDFGRSWSHNSTGQNLASTGLGLRLQWDRFTARIDWGIPFIDLDSRDRTWQEKGIYFSINTNLF